MKEILIGENNAGQRIDRFLRKYLSNAPISLVYKLIRKKNVKVNEKKINENYILKINDVIKLYIADDLIKLKKEKSKSYKDLNIIYENNNIIIVNKPIGILTHSAKKEDYGKTMVDQLIAYLIYKEDYVPRLEPTFTPAFVNRIDMNTSGIIIAGKNRSSIVKLNQAIKENKIRKLYKTIVLGEYKENNTIESYLTKDANKNIVSISDKKINNTSKEIITKLLINKSNKNYSELIVELVTGRTHQIRAHLSSIKHPIIGDTKYGNKEINKMFKKDFNLNHQLLHSWKVAFDSDIISTLDIESQYFICEESKLYKNILSIIIGNK